MNMKSLSALCKTANSYLAALLDLASKDIQANPSTLEPYTEEMSNEDDAFLNYSDDWETVLSREQEIDIDKINARLKARGYNVQLPKDEHE